MAARSFGKWPLDFIHSFQRKIISVNHEILRKDMAQGLLLGICIANSPVQKDTNVLLAFSSND